MHVSMPDNVNAHATKNTSPCFVVPCDAPLRTRANTMSSPPVAAHAKKQSQTLLRENALSSPTTKHLRYAQEARLSAALNSKTPCQ